MIHSITQCHSKSHLFTGDEPVKANRMHIPSIYVPFVPQLIPKSFQHLTMRKHSTVVSPPELTHVDRDGTAKMVDVAAKNVTFRTAMASATVKVGAQVADLIHKNSLKKGDVMSIAQIAGIIGAKRTSEIIPLCHNINLSSVNVHVKLHKERQEVIITSVVQCDGKTGVEMEALTAVSVAALTVYDMCKAVCKAIIITDIKLLSKTGGKSGDYVNEEIELREYNKRPTTNKFSPFVGPM